MSGSLRSFSQRYTPAKQTYALWHTKAVDQQGSSLDRDHGQCSITSSQIAAF
jgi:hypothetical protein